MEVSRQEGRGRASRPRLVGASNKENICPFKGSSAAAEMGRRRSPLPEGFPRSPLQDITHIICPNNIWPESEDPPTGQVHKKSKKGLLAESCTANKTESDLSWKGVMPCLPVRLGTNEAQIEETSNDKVNAKQSTVNKVVATCEEAKENGFLQGFFICRDDVANNASFVQVWNSQDVENSDSKEQKVADREALGAQARSTEEGSSAQVIREALGARARSTEEGSSARAQLIEHEKTCAVEDLKLKSRGRCAQMPLRGEIHKRPQKSTELKKKSTLLMLR
eukprot:c37102_g1_i1 orf=31-867(+)